MDDELAAKAREQREKNLREKEYPKEWRQRVTYQGREFIYEADFIWRDSWGFILDWNEEKKIPEILDPFAEPWKTHSMARWGEKAIADRRWFATDWLPFGQTVGVYGRPGSRKSTFMLQLMIAAVLGGKGLGPTMKIAHGPAYGLFCEDDEMELARRARAILSGYGAGWGDCQDLHAESLVLDKPPKLVASQRGRMITTPAWNKFLRDLDRIKPVFVCLDTLPYFHDADEINRGPMTEFIHQLDSAANERSLSLVYAAHPSLLGLSSKTYASGSTGIGGATRARTTFTDPTDEDGDPNANQSDSRVWTLLEANYAKGGQTLDLVFRDGLFIPADLDKPTQEAKKRAPLDQAAAENYFLTKLKEICKQGRYVSDAKGNVANYAPAAFAAKEYPMGALEGAMKRLFDKGVISIDNRKRKSDRWVFNDGAPS